MPFRIDIEHRMRSFCIFLGALLAGLLIAATIAYPAWLLVSHFDDFPFHKVTRRLATLFGLGCAFLVLRRLRVDRAAIGYNLPPALFSRRVAIAFGIGIAMMVPLMLTLLGLDIRDVKAQLDADPSRWLGVFGAALATGIAVAFLEETFFRGALQTAVTRESGTALGVALPALLYASVHFLGGSLKISAEQASFASGFDVLGSMFEKYAQPAALVDSFLALLAVGLLLALVRRRTGSLAACIGLHAGWVTTITVLRSATKVDRTSDHAWLVGSYDGVIGWAALAFLGTMGLAYWAFGRTRQPKSA
jgi:membrane protease YdiL (CAAX protease family)